VPIDVVASILDYLDQPSLLHAIQVCTQFKRAAKRYFLAERREIVCFHSKMGYNQTILGIGIEVKSANGKIILLYYLLCEEISSACDIISLKSFSTDKIRAGVWGNSFNFWVPLLINPSYNKRVNAVRLLKDNLHKMKFSDPKAPWKPEIVLQILPRLMNVYAIFYFTISLL
jgi:hypothetical protein